MTTKYIAGFRNLCEPLTEIEVPIGFNDISLDLYALFTKLETFPRPQGYRRMSETEEEERQHQETMQLRRNILQSFETVLQKEVDAYNTAMEAELKKHRDRAKEALNPRTMHNDFNQFHSEF